MSGKADVGLATEGPSQFVDQISVPCYSWNHAIVVQDNHRLLAHAAPVLAELATYPLITYDTGFTTSTN